MTMQTGTDPALAPPARQARSSADGHHPVGYTDSGEIVGRGPGEYVWGVLLAVTACADLAVFHQTLSILMELSTAEIVWLAVAGFTACSLTLAHMAGRLHRDIEVGYGAWGRAPRAALVIVWLLLGLAAFTVRLLIEYTSGGGDAAVAGAGSDPGRAWGGALLFLVLYLGSGLVAACGAYHTRNPLRDRYHKAVRSVRTAQKRLQRSQPPYERAVNVLQLQVRNRQGEEANYTAARELRIAYAQEARSLVGLLVAQHLQSPPATTGLTTPRRAGTLTSTTDHAQDTTS
jgi:hypothetical protein